MHKPCSRSVRTVFQYDKICFIICARGDDRSRALRKDVVEAGEKAAAEQALHEKHEARVIEAEQELQRGREEMRDLGAEFNGERIRTHQGASGHELCPGGNPKHPAGDPRGEEDRGG